MELDIYNMVSFAGVLILLIVAWLLSADRKIVNFRVVGWGVILQLVLALFIFLIPAGAKLFLFINDAVVAVLDSATAGTKFLFGRLALAPGTANNAGETSLGFFLAFQALPTVIFFASLMGVLYFLGVMTWLVRGFAYVFTKLMRISGAESLCASSNIFVGIEAALTVRPYLGRMTKSELCTILTAGMATVASSMLAVYVMILKEEFPTIAGHLVSASILSAPAAVVMSKLIYPETEHPETLGEAVKPYSVRENNIFEAIINGANAGVKLVVGIVALLLAFLGLVALTDKLLALVGSVLDGWFGIDGPWSLKELLGYVFYPFSLIVGIPFKDAGTVAQLIGERAILTEVVAYQDLGALLKSGFELSPRSIVITSYALTGFAHVASLAIFVGGIAALVPERMRDLSKLGLRALVAATLACLMTAAVAGVFFVEGSILLGR